MNKELNQTAKKYNFLQKLQLESFVDAIDENRWKVARIVGFRNVGHRSSIRLHFDGYPDSWDQEFDLPASSKLAAFRRYTLPYTGPIDKQIYRPITSLNFQAPLAILKKIGRQEKEKLQPNYIIQKFRGEIFILVDTLLTQNIKLKQDQYEQVLHFLEAYIETGFNILKYSLQKIPQTHKENTYDPNFIYVNPIHAIISSIPQILFNFNSMVSAKEKRVRLYANGQVPAQEMRKQMRNFLKGKDIVSICKTVLEYQAPPARGFSWAIKKEVLVLLAGLEELLEFPKIQDNREIPDALDMLGYLRQKQAFSDQTIEQINIELILTLIMSGNFQGKLKGLAELKRLCEGIYSLRKEVLKEKVLTPSLLSALTDNATFNGQIFKRSLPIFQAAGKLDLLSDDILKRIINLHKDKHQLQLKSYFETLAQFGSILAEKKVLYFFDQLKKFTLNIDMINLIKQYTLNVIKNHAVYRRKYMSPETGLGLVFLWEVIKQEGSPQIVSQAITAFSFLAGDLFYREAIEKYLLECFANIKAGKNVENSLKIIHSCLNKNREIVNIVQNIDKQFNIIDTLVKSLIEAESISSKTIESIFEFVEEVNQYAKRKITVDHIKDLWNLKECHTNLLKFMRKYSLTNKQKQKSHQKIIFKKLSLPQIRQIFTKIFLNKILMQGYQNCDEQLFKTIDQLLVSYNHRNKAIEYNFKHCIRCINPHELFGLEVYLEIVLHCKDEGLVAKGLKRFVEFFLRPFRGKMQVCKVDRVGLWMLCAEKLTKYLDQSNKKYLGYATLFEQIKGRMKSINILDPSQTTFTVLLKQSNIRKTFTMPKNCSLWKLRHSINTQFKLNNTNFEIYLVERRSITDMELQEDFSLIYIEAPKDPASICVVVTESKEMHPHFVAIQEFKGVFSGMYAEKIYDSLEQIKNFDIQLAALDILLKIPTIKSLQSKMAKLDIGKQASWDQILDGECRPRLCYQISIINKVKTAGISWVTNFIKKGGVQHIQKILRNRSTGKLPLNSKDYSFLSQLLSFFNQIIQFYRLHQPSLPFNEASIIELLKLSPKDKANPQLLQDPAFLDYFYLAFTALEEMITRYPLDGEKILTSPAVWEILDLLLFTDKRTDMQGRFPAVLFNIFQKAKCDKVLSELCMRFLTNLLSNPKLRYSCRILFDLLVFIFDHNYVTNELYGLTLKFIETIRYSPAQIYFQPQNQTNQLINGWLRTCKCLLFKSITDNNLLKCIPEPQQKFADFLIKNGLFGDGHRFESQRCRLEAFEILSQLNCRKLIMENIGAQIVPVITRGTWRKQNQWFVRSMKRREKNKEVGLKNLAATCYINSLLQQLYHIKEFSEPLLGIDSKAIQTPENIAYELQKIFAYLKYSNRQVFTTETLCQTFISDGQPIDPRIQMDIDQFFHTLMDKLEHNLIKIGKQNIIDDVFKGQYSNLIIGQECQHKSQRIQHFLSMRLEIIGKSSLTQALTEFIKGEVLEGENAYFCEKCNKKIKAVKRVCVKSLPDVLILTLKRFEFDFDRMEKFKLNTFCEFEENLNMGPYTREFLYENQERLPAEQYQYKLKGVVIHYGVSEAGHYTSYIRIQNGEWKYFDDDKISNFDFKNLGDECFGGNDDNPYSDNSEKLKNAYLLIYERVKKNNIAKVDTNANIKSEVDAQNLNNQQVKIIFERSLQNFCDVHSLAMGKNYLLFVHLVTLRSQQRSTLLKKCYDNCISILQSNPQIAQWYLQQFSQNLIKQFLIFSVSEVSYFVASLLIFAINKCVNSQFIKRCMKCIDRKNMLPLCKVFQAAAHIVAYAKILAEYSFGEKIYKIIKEDKAPNQGSLVKIQTLSSDFGEPYTDFYDKKDYRNSIELIQCIEFFKFKNFPKEDIEPLARRAKKLSTQVYLAKFLASKFKDDQSFSYIASEFILPILTKFEPKFQEEYMFRFVLILMAKICDSKQQVNKRKIFTIAELYIAAIRESLDGYKAMRLLISGLFSLCFNNQLARQEFVNLLNQKDNKKYVKAIRDWMKDSDKAYMNVKTDRMGYWKRIGRSSYAALERIEADPKIPSQKYLSLFNALLEKHKIQFPDLWSPSIKKGQKILLVQNAEEEYEVIDKFGLILQIKGSQGNERVILEDDAFPLRSV